MEPWFFLEHDRCQPFWNMACDQWLLLNVQRLGQPVLRTYGWDRPSISIGYFQPYPSTVKAHYLVVRRPTGGALVYHDSDLTFTVALPPGHPWKKLSVCGRYEQVHQRVKTVFDRKGLMADLAPSPLSSVLRPPHSERLPALCFSKATRYDVELVGVKVVGGAQRVTRDGLIHQGSIQAGPQWPVSPQELKGAWESSGVSFEKLNLSSQQHAEIDELVQGQFGTDSWNSDGNRN